MTDLFLYQQDHSYQQDLNPTDRNVLCTNVVHGTSTTLHDV